MVVPQRLGGAEEVGYRIGVARQGLWKKGKDRQNCTRVDAAGLTMYGWVETG